MAVVMIVDDSNFQRGILRRIVIEAGHEVLEANDGSDALDMLKEHDPDIILSDLIMSDMGGLSLLENLREKNSDIPVIIITADTQDSTRRKCLELGAKTVLLKPVTADDLRGTIEETLSIKEGTPR